jgi:hypothetical protein
VPLSRRRKKKDRSAGKKSRRQSGNPSTEKVGLDDMFEMLALLEERAIELEAEQKEKGETE